MLTFTTHFTMLILLLIFVTTSFANEVKHNSVYITRKEFDDYKATIKETLSAQSATIENLKTHIQHQDHVIHELKSHNADPKSVLTGQEVHERSLKPRQSGNNIVAFFAIMTIPSQDHVGINQNLVFEDVKTNIGGAYNNHLGVFIAPVSGLYLITSTILSRQNMEFWAAIVVNGTEVVHLNERGTDGRHGSASQSVTIKLKKGDDVSVQNILHTDEAYWGDMYSSFGGFLITEIEDEVIVVG